MSFEVFLTIFRARLINGIEQFVHVGVGIPLVRLGPVGICSTFGRFVHLFRILPSKVDFIFRIPTAIRLVIVRNEFLQPTALQQIITRIVCFAGSLEMEQQPDFKADIGQCDLYFSTCFLASCRMQRIGVFCRRLPVVYNPSDIAFRRTAKYITRRCDEFLGGPFGCPLDSRTCCFSHHVFHILRRAASKCCAKRAASKIGDACTFSRSPARSAAKRCRSPACETARAT